MNCSNTSMAFAELDLARWARIVMMVWLQRMKRKLSTAPIAGSQAFSRDVVIEELELLSFPRFVSQLLTHCESLTSPPLFCHVWHHVTDSGCAQAFERSALRHSMPVEAMSTLFIHRPHCCNIALQKDRTTSRFRTTSARPEYYCCSCPVCQHGLG